MVSSPSASETDPVAGGCEELRVCDGAGNSPVDEALWVSRGDPQEPQNAARSSKKSSHSSHLRSD